MVIFYFKGKQMNCKEIIDNVLSREGLYRVIADPFATTDLIVQENIRILKDTVFYAVSAIVVSFGIVLLGVDK